MDRNTIIAIVLSVIVITVGMTVNAVFFPTDYSTQTTTTETGTVEVVDDIDTVDVSAVSQAEDTSEFDIDTEAFSVTFDPAGASVSSIRLKNHLESTSHLQ